jgi:hypothetical protein
MTDTQRSLVAVWPPSSPLCRHPTEAVSTIHPFKFPEGKNVWKCEGCGDYWIEKHGAFYVPEPEIEPISVA